MYRALALPSVRVFMSLVSTDSKAGARMKGTEVELARFHGFLNCLANGTSDCKTRERLPFSLHSEF